VGACAAGLTFAYDAAEPVGKTIAALFEAMAEEHLMQPTIIYEFPTAVSPLSKQKPDEPDWTERF
jgi:lysyl-tRNA synthetase, class II